MLHSPLNNENIKIKTDLPVNFELSHFSIKGSNLTIEGYASIRGLYSYSEDRIRKTLMFIPDININELKSEEEYQDLTEEEILELKTIKIPLINCKYKNRLNNSLINDMDSLGGFNISLDLERINNGKPLEKGSYTIYIKLEQLSNDNDDIKYIKIVPLSSIKKFLKNDILTANLHYFSANNIKKYNLVITFDEKEKTLKFENQLLKSYNPKEISIDGEEKAEHKIIKAIKRRFFKFCYIMCSLFPVNKKKITFASDSRSELNGNLYFVYEEIYRQNLDVNIKLILNKRIDNRKSFIQLMVTAFHFATSKIILLDDFYPLVYPLKIRKKSDLIQVWHAAGAFKTFGFSRIGRPGGPSPKSRNHRNYTKVTVSSKSVREHYAEGFGISIDKVYATGVPRSDIFFDEEYKEYVRKTLYNKYPFLKKKKVILYAPTFRGNGQESAFFPYYVLDLKMLYENLRDEYIFLFKIHPFVKNKLSIPYQYSDFFYDFSDFREINDLLLVTDVLITDYSSVCFEFALLEKPMLFFAFDLEDYIRTRDFYYDYNSFIPGPIVKSTKEIVDTIKNGRFQLEKVKPFVNYFFDDTLGKASKNVVKNVIIPSLESDYEHEEFEDRELDPPKSRIELFERSLRQHEEEL